MAITLDKIPFKLLEKKASKLFKNHGRLLRLLFQSLEVLKNQSLRLEIKANVLTFVEMAKAYVTGAYRQVSTKNLILIIIGLIYLVMPLDLIPDFIPITGFLDDSTVVAAIYKLLIVDIDRFKDWKSKP